MKHIIAALPLVLLAACHSATPATGVGSPAWLKRVDTQLAISDGQGHGPDYGSQEWCDAVHFKLHGQRPTEPVACDMEWMREVDRKILDDHSR